MNISILVIVLSWEDRFILGLERDIAAFNPRKVILFKYISLQVAEWKKENLQKAREIIGDKLEEIDLDSTKPSENWSIFRATFAMHCQGHDVVVDITTMTREAIWFSLYNCKINKCNTHYVYYKPEGYASDWISRDPVKPRLLYKMSGIAKLGAGSLLVVTGGYDIQRLDSLIYNFEPKQTMLFFQDGDDHRNTDNFIQCKELFRSKYGIELLYEYDAYDIEASYNLILSKLTTKENGNCDTYLTNYNVILNSLGAKTSAITLFNIWLKYPHVALSYIPSKEYNKNYSFGIGDVYTGKIPF